MKISWSSLLPTLQPSPTDRVSKSMALPSLPPSYSPRAAATHINRGTTCRWHYLNTDIVSIDGVTWLSSMLVQVLPGLPVFYAVLPWRRPHGDCSVSHRCTSPGPGHFRGTAVNLLSLLTNWVDGQNWGLQSIFLVRRLGFISQSNWLFWQ